MAHHAQRAVPHRVDGAVSGQVVAQRESLSPEQDEVSVVLLGAPGSADTNVGESLEGFMGLFKSLKGVGHPTGRCAEPWIVSEGLVHGDIKKPTGRFLY